MENKRTGRPVIGSRLHSTSDYNRKWFVESQRQWLCPIVHRDNTQIVSQQTNAIRLIWTLC